MSDKCKWENTGDGEFVTGCRQEFYLTNFELETRLEQSLFVYCPYCGKKIEQLTTSQG